jgi:hypothetical protein
MNPASPDPSVTVVMSCRLHLSLPNPTCSWYYNMVRRYTRMHNCYPKMNVMLIVLIGVTKLQYINVRSIGGNVPIPVLSTMHTSSLNVPVQTTA